MYFRGKLVDLRAITEDDIKYATEYLNNPEIKLLLDTDPPIPKSLERQKEWFNEHIKSKDYYEGIELAIVTKEGKYIGNCGANHIDRKNRIADIGIFVGNPDYLGKGYGTEAIKLFIDFLFQEMNVNKVKLLVFSFNERAVKSYQKCGFKIEAVGREAIFRYGKYHDEYTMGLLKEEYFANEVQN